MNSPTAVDNVLDSLNLVALRALYRYAALVLADPLVGAWPDLTDGVGQQLVSAAATLLRQDPAAEAAELDWGEPASQLCPQGLFASLPRSAEAWNARYKGTFGLLVSSGYPPYETEYIDCKLSFQRAQAMADIRILPGLWLEAHEFPSRTTRPHRGGVGVHGRAVRHASSGRRGECSWVQ